MTIREQFKRKVIEAIHGLEYSRAIRREPYLKDCEIEHGATICDQCELEYKPYPITIGRVMQGLKDAQPITLDANGIITVYKADKDEQTPILDFQTNWKLTKENGQEADDDDQSDETINQLLKIL